jgi:hypothetical protein
MAKFRNKSIVVEAFQLTYEMAKGQSPCPIWFAEATEKGDVKVFVTDKIHNSQYSEIKTLNGIIIADAKDYIVKGIEGEIYPCKSDIFEAFYEKVD